MRYKISEYRFAYLCAINADYCDINCDLILNPPRLARASFWYLDRLTSHVNEHTCLSHSKLAINFAFSPLISPFIFLDHTCVEGVIFNCNRIPRFPDNTGEIHMNVSRYEARTSRLEAKKYAWIRHMVNRIGNILSIKALCTLFAK